MTIPALSVLRSGLCHEWVDPDRWLLTGWHLFAGEVSGVFPGETPARVRSPGVLEDGLSCIFAGSAVDHHGGIQTSAGAVLVTTGAMPVESGD